MKFNNLPTFYRDIKERDYQAYLHDLYMKSVTRSYEPKEESTIDGLMDQEVGTLRDKLSLTESIISERLKLHDEFSYILNYSWLNVKTALNNLPFTDAYSRRKSSLENSLLAIDKQMMDERRQLWEDIVSPMSYFLKTFNDYKNMKGMNKLIK